VLCCGSSEIQIIVTSSLKVTTNQYNSIYIITLFKKKKLNYVNCKYIKVLRVTSHIYSVKCLFFDTKKRKDPHCVHLYCHMHIYINNQVPKHHCKDNSNYFLKVNLCLLFSGKLKFHLFYSFFYD